MPRDGAGVYSTPPGTDGIPDTTILSTPYNINVHDVEHDLNYPRPIVAGGTGASDAATARSNIGAEASMQVVDDYNTFPFQAGSFKSDTTAASAPVAGHHFQGIAVVYDSTNIVLIAYDIDNNSAQWSRVKVSNVWGNWFNNSDAISNKVNKTGDTMSGALTISMTNPTLALNKTATNQANQVIGYLSNVPLWLLDLGNPSGGNFELARYNDAGSNLGSPIAINRLNGQITFGNGTAAGAWIAYFNGAGIAANNGVLIDASDATGGTALLVRGNNAGTLMSVNKNNGTQVYGTTGGWGLQVINNVAPPSYGLMVNGGTSASDWGLAVNNATGTTQMFGVKGNGDGMLSGSMVINGALNTHSDITADRGNNIGSVRLGNAGTCNVTFDGANLVIQSGAGSISYNTGQIHSWRNQGNAQVAYMAMTNGEFLIGGQAYKPGGGSWVDSSDARIKTILGEYDAGLAEILALNPKRFVYKGNDTYEHMQETSPHKLVAETRQEYIGLIAQEAQPTMPELIHSRAGWIDGQPTDILSIEATPLFYALINAVKQLAARVEALEHAQANP